ncbi:MAG: hypothetical protein ACI9XO_003312 [Paraglaciecola sp.]|jgi:hypothetical protein
MVQVIKSFLLRNFEKRTKKAITDFIKSVMAFILNSILKN